MPEDSVLKILMQKVRSLDLSLSILERYLEEVNSKYDNIFKEINKDLGECHNPIFDHFVIIIIIYWKK